MSRQLNELRIKQNNLEELCKHLIAQNHQLIEENASMLKKIKEDSQDKEKQLEQFLVSILLNQRNQKQLLVGEQEKGLGLIESYKGTALTNSTPLEVLSHSLNRNEQVKIIKNALECAHYGKKAIRRKENNFTIVNPRNEEVEFEHSYSPIPHRPEEGDDFLLEKNDTSLLSANDFLDADGYDEINLDESR